VRARIYGRYNHIAKLHACRYVGPNDSRASRVEAGSEAAVAAVQVTALLEGNRSQPDLG
jgi:hypothetical protein